MAGDAVQNYGWDTVVPESCGYIAPEVIRILRGMNARKVLDLGCGNGALCGLLNGMGLEVAGVEYDKAGVELARSKHADIPFFNLGVQDDPAEVLATCGVQDVVVSTEVIEHLFAPHLLPIFAGKLLKQGGKLIVSTPYHGYLKNLAICLTDHWDQHHTPLWHGGHIKFWSRATLSRLLEENGFKVTGFSGVGRMPYLWKSMILVAEKT
jgi:2-polyprenyl-3-methyl-5-hydroxy-6-metoxy-1,4-benzoquinol methylase